MLPQLLNEDSEVFGYAFVVKNEHTVIKHLQQACPNYGKKVCSQSSDN